MKIKIEISIDTQLEADKEELKDLIELLQILKQESEDLDD